MRRDDSLPIEDSGLDAALESAQARFVSETAAEKQLRWEASVVKKILQVGGAPNVFAALQREARDTTGNDQVYFSNFLEQYPKFPLWLHCAKIPYVFATSGGELLDQTKTRKSKIWLTYLEAQECADGLNSGGRDVGLVFEWLHSGGQHKILHPHLYKINDDEEGNEHTFRIRCPDKRVRKYRLESLTDYLIGIGWADSLAK